MPDDLIQKIISSRYINQGLSNLRQLYFGKFDLMVHGQRCDSPREPQAGREICLNRDVS